MDLDFRILNVFTDGDDPFSGNPLGVFTDARGLTDDQMQALARQLNLSETTFIVPDSVESAESADSADSTGGASGPVTATVRIFTPSYELPFAGHPTLGTAHVVRDITNSGDDVVLRLPAGDIPVTATGDQWTLRANPATSTPAGDPADVASAAGLAAETVAGPPLWVDTGTTQLVLPVRSVDDVRAAVAVPDLMRQHATRAANQSMLYVWAPAGEDTIEARMFFAQNGSYPEDPATGSACANLGGWFLANGYGVVHRTVRQGAAVGRPSVLELDVDDAGVIRVSGTVREVARGTFMI